ncbi:MAG: protein translocase subunit SecF [Myxococcota bacterium]|nr:protein translocase subunit SecF [Myxococcales bacterium]
MFEIIPHGTHLDFIGKARLCVAISLAMVAASVVAVFVVGVHLGIDFAGGTELHAKFASAPVDEGRVRDVVNGVPGLKDVSVVRFGGAEDNEFLIRFQNVADEADAAAAGSTDADERLRADRVSSVERALSGAIGGYERQSVDFVGPRVGSELRADGFKSIGLAMLLIMIYIAFRFSSRFAPGAVVAVFHDLIITAGIFVMLGYEFDLRILAAMLAILGYSLNDTIIIYDRIRENLEARTSRDLAAVLNESVNQTLSRTVLTSGTTLIAVLALAVLGGEVIRPFAVAMLIGVFVGTYSSIYIAAPTLMLLEARAARRAKAG